MAVVHSFDAYLGAALRDYEKDRSVVADSDNTYATIFTRTHAVFRETRRLMLGDRPRMIDETFGDDTENEQTYDRAQARIKSLNHDTRPRAIVLMRAALEQVQQIDATPAAREAKREACRALIAALDTAYEGIVRLGPPNYGRETYWHVKRPVFAELT